jgi:hypothetical protein
LNPQPPVPQTGALPLSYIHHVLECSIAQPR